MTDEQPTIEDIQQMAAEAGERKRETQHKRERERTAQIRNWEQMVR